MDARKVAEDAVPVQKMTYIAQICADARKSATGDELLFGRLIKMNRNTDKV